MTTKEEFQRLLGRNIRRVRNTKALTVERLALEAGVTYSQISRIELGKRNPSCYTIFVISRTLGVSPSEFFDTLTKEK